jgi:hypothetical protein
MRCTFCNRPLRTAKARRLRAGAGCLKKFPGYRDQKKVELEGQLNLFRRGSGHERRRTLRRVRKSAKAKK